MRNSSLTIEDFKELIDLNAYYVDKTQFIIDCIKEKCVLYTRPRRFGKTLNMSMLYYFFSNKEKDNAYLFDGLKVANYPEVMKHQNQYPVIFISLKELDNSTFQSQINLFSNIIFKILDKNYKELLTSDQLSDARKEILNQLIFQKASIDQLKVSLETISQSLYQHYHKKVIILIDEYDVPLQAAYQNGYYEEMVDFLRNVFSSSLKSNDSLEKGILTGCLRISKESIFTGLNNFNVYSILDKGNEENFGFTENEVKQMLEDYHISDCFDDVKKWYDGYLFGDKEIYNPWSTIKYIKKNIENNVKLPQPYWANTSGNNIVYNYIKNATPKLREEFETLLHDGTVIKEINPELTYREMSDINNIYSFLLLTGYLKIKSQVEEIDEYNRNKTITKYELIIPNEEVYQIYRKQFSKYFENYVGERLQSLYNALMEGNEKLVMKLLNEILSKKISYYDNKESFYHGFLTGLFSGYNIQSNKESGDGRFDLCISPEDGENNVGVIIECKHSSEAKNLVNDAKKALKQINDKNYRQDLEGQGCEIKEYGISFYKKRCYIVKAE